jgi:hypothetical protein
MLSRALSLATVTLLIGCLAAVSARAQENLEAGKSPAQIFAGTCNACHKTPRGLLRTVSPGSLPGFLREHYTTSPNMAGVLSSFLIANGATDTRGQKQAKQEAKPGEPLDRNGRKPPAQEAKRTPEPGKPAAEGQSPKQAAIEPGREGPKESPKAAARSKFGKRGKPGEESPSGEEGKPDIAKGEPGEPPKEDAAKSASAKDEGAKPEHEGRPEGKSESKSEGTPEAKSEAKPDGKSASARVDAPKDSSGSETPGIRPDPVPPVTPAPATPAPAASAAPAAVASVSPPAAPEAPAAAPMPAVAASAAPLPPVAPAGPPAPPISQ